jgi:predicted tellurium resistance membrane protein TerC
VKKDAQNNKMVFEKLNYVLLGASLIVLVIGFAMMSGTTDIYNSTKVTVAPIIVMLGFTLGIVAIFYKGKSKSGE